MNQLKEQKIMEMDYFKQKIYEISGIPKSSLEKIEEEPLSRVSRDEAHLEHRFEKFIEYIIKTKSNKNI